MAHTLGFTPIDIDWDALARRDQAVFDTAYQNLGQLSTDCSERDFVWQ